MLHRQLSPEPHFARASGASSDKDRRRDDQTRGDAPRATAGHRRRATDAARIALLGSAWLWVCIVMPTSRVALAQVKATDAGGVIVTGAADTFDPVREAIARAAAGSGRRYRVVVLGELDDATDARTALDRLLDGWRDRPSTTGGVGFNPASDVAILLDLDGRTLAIKMPHAVGIASGLDTAAVERDLIARVFVPRAKDGLYAEGLAALVDATEQVIERRAAAARRRAESARVFRTRTLPLGIAGLAVAGVVGGLAVQRARHASRLRTARGKLAAFKSDVVALSELLDEQQERHRMLPHTDPDFLTAMEGQTRGVYDSVQEAIRRYRERWLGLMDVWEAAQAKVDGEWFLGTAAADEAIRLLDSAEARPPLDDVAGECRGPLDALETAHELAREQLAALDTGLAAASARAEALAERGRSGGAFQSPLAEIARVRGHAADELEADPVAARGRLEAATAALGELDERLEALEAADDRRRRAVGQLEEAEARVRERRAEGWLLTEQGANPDALLAEARNESDLAAQLLDAGDSDTAAGHLDRAEHAVAEAVALVERVVAARARVEELLPACAARLEALAARREPALRDLEHLADRFAERSWSDVADNVSRADEGLGRVHTLVLEARQSAEPAVQAYFRAVALLEEADRQEDWTDECLTAISRRRAELDELVAMLPRRRDATRHRTVELERRLHRQRTDRPRANERCREAMRLLEIADDGLNATRPDLPRVAQLIAAADEAYGRGEQLADEDERLARQARDDLDETDAALRRIAAWYAEGVQADVRAAVATLDTARSLLGRQRYEEAIAAAAEASRAGRAAYAAATAEAERRRRQRQQEIQRRRMAESFERMSRGAGPWMIQLPGGALTGPNPWRSMQGTSRPMSVPTRSAGGGWSRDIAQGSW